MARPKKYVVDCFEHSSLEVKPVTLLENKYGNDGYAFWYKLMEVLSQSDGHYLDCRDEMNWQYFCQKTRLNNVQCSEMVDLLVEIGVIDPLLWQKRVIWVQEFVNNLCRAYTKRKRFLPEKPNCENNSDVFDTSIDVFDTETPQKLLAEELARAPATNYAHSMVSQLLKERTNSK